jgi:hypothetical protein
LTFLCSRTVASGTIGYDRVRSIGATQHPIGVEKDQYASALLLLAQLFNGFLAMPNQDPSADLLTWKLVLDEGEPYGKEVHAVEDELHDFHAGIDLLRRRRPAPLLLMSGFTDDLFPASQAVRVYLALQKRRNAPVTLQLGDLGHPRAQNKLEEYQYFNDEGARFFDAYLRDLGTPPAPGAVTAFTQTCPVTAPAGGPFVSPSLTELATGSLRFGDAAPQTVTSDGGDPAVAAGTNPIFGAGICATYPAENAPGTAVYTMPSPGVLLMGEPLLTARIRTRGPFGQIVGRLWDVNPAGRQALVAGGVYRLRPNQKGKIAFQLEGNAYTFPAGHTIRLELVGGSPPTFRKSNGTFTVTVEDAQLELPTRSGSPSGAFVS